MKRRDFLYGMCSGGLATFHLPTIRFAHLPSQRRFMFVFLRGGVDGLATVVPVDDPSYQTIRAAMALPAEGLHRLADGFALAPGLAPLMDLWARDELVALQAMAIPYRTRSHFEGQAILETGLGGPSGAADGWMNRLLQIMDGQGSGMAVAAGIPRSMAGDYPITTWSPAQLGIVDDAFLERLHLLYRQDAVLLNPFEAAINLQQQSGELEMGSNRGRGGMVPVFTAAARFLREPSGPNVAAVEFSGWDTHANQGVADGPLDRLLGQLAAGVMTFRSEMGERWSDTVVVVMTEFGRTARPNGTRGTDHGTAGAGFVIGPRVGRSRVISDWPGLGERELFEGRDVRGTIDTRSILKGVIAGLFDLTSAQLERVFPESAASPAFLDVMLGP